MFYLWISHSAVVHEFQGGVGGGGGGEGCSLIWKSFAILFSLKCKNHPMLEIQTQQCHESSLELLRKSYFIFDCRCFLKNANWTWKLLSDFHDFIKFSAKRQPLLLLLPITSATSPSNYDIKMFEMKSFIRWIIHWQTSVNHCLKCDKSQ